MSKTSRTSRVLSALGSRHLFWLVLIGLVIVMTFWWIPGDGTGTADSYSAEADGKLAYYKAVQAMHPTTRRSADRLIPIDAGTIVILNPARIPDDDEWSALYGFVSGGGTLLYVSDTRSENFRAGQFGVSLDNAWDGTQDVLPFDPTELGAKESAATTAFGRSVNWQSDSTLETSAYYPAETLVSTGAGVQAVRLHVGGGFAVFVSSDVIFQNRSLLDANKAVVAYRLLESARPASPIYFDESLNSSGTPRVLGILFTPMFRPISLQLLLVAILFGWWGSRRFGPARMPRSTDRRAIVEHAQALGNMHYKVGTASSALRAYFEYFRNVANLPTGRIDKVAAALAARSGADASEIERLLSETQKAIQDDRIGPGAAATLIQQLAALRAQMARVSREA